MQYNQRAQGSISYGTVYVGYEKVLILKEDKKEWNGLSNDCVLIVSLNGGLVESYTTTCLSQET